MLGRLGRGPRPRLRPRPSPGAGARCGACSGRRLCPRCRCALPPGQPSSARRRACATTAAPRSCSGRTTRKTWCERRLEVYREQTLPVIAAYSRSARVCTSTWTPRPRSTQVFRLRRPGARGMSRMVPKSPAEIGDHGPRATASSATILRGAPAKIRPGVSHARDRPLRGGAHPPTAGRPPSRAIRTARTADDFPGTVLYLRERRGRPRHPSQHVSCARETSSPIDLGMLYRGYYGDAAVTFPVGKVERGGRAPAAGDARSARSGIERGQAGQPASRTSVTRSRPTREQNGYLGGAGVRRARHRQLRSTRSPQIPNYGAARARDRVCAGDGARDRADGERRRAPTWC